MEIRQDALADIEEAPEWYDAQQSGLGADFANTVLAAIERLPQSPLIYQIRERRISVRCFCRLDFPTGLFIESTVISSRSLPSFIRLVTSASGASGRESYSC